MAGIGSGNLGLGKSSMYVRGGILMSLRVAFSYNSNN